VLVDITKGFEFCNNKINMSLDGIAFVTSCLMVQLYYLYLHRQSRRDPASTVTTINAYVRNHWVKMVMMNDAMGILAIQTLRNSLIAANFMASTAILLMMGALSSSEKIGQWVNKLQIHAMATNSSTDLWQVKLCLLLFVFAITFYYFSMAVRFYNHVGYMINLPNDDNDNNEHYKITCAYLNRAGYYYTYGTRTFFFSMPIVMWFFGPYFLLGATVILLIGLAMLDKAPN
jgi:uncharacterized membrane protein